MNNKHIACVLLILAIALIVQFTLSMNNRMMKTQGEANRARAAVSNASTRLQIERSQLAELEKSSKPLTDYLKVWQPYFAAIDSAQNAELKISLRIKESGVVSLSQKFGPVGNASNPSLPNLMRAQLVFEDNYVKLLNWLGQIESQLPTLRTKSLTLTRGSNQEDVRMQLVLEQPLAKLP
jgi:hypothetical protein